MTKTINDQGFISVVYEGKTHKDLHTYLFACFLSQEEPNRIAKDLSDSTWVEAMQEELLQFKLQQVWVLVDLPKGKRAIDVRTDSTPMDTEQPLLKDSDGDDVYVHLYRSMIGSLMYLTLSRPDIMFADATDIMAVAKSKLWFLSPPSSTEAEYVAASSVLDKQSSMIRIGDTSSGVLSLKELRDIVSSKTEREMYDIKTDRVNCTLENGDMEITTIIDGKVKVVSKVSISRHLKLEESDGTLFPSVEIFDPYHSSLFKFQENFLGTI
ncbi:hypothetical protein Tco_0169517 [Tanacetum coccineum]